MTLNFQIRTTSEGINYKELKDVVDLGIAEEQYITITQLASEFRMTREAITGLLDSKKVMPIAKIMNRTTDGKLKDGRPKLAYSPEIAKKAIEEAVEEKYS